MADALGRASFGFPLKLRKSILPQALRPVNFPEWLGLPGRLSQHGRRMTEAVEVLAPASVRRPEQIVPEEIIQEGFPQSGQLCETLPVAGIVDRQPEKFECPVERPEAVFGIVLFPPREGPLDLAPDVGQLDDERERVPTPRGQVAMLGAHGVMSLSTISMIFALIAGSSTPRERFPWEGRMLIIESNSTRSGMASSG